jgi:beta-glucanase (GH16 family)
MIQNLSFMHASVLSGILFLASTAGGIAAPEGAFLSRMDDVAAGQAWFLSNFAIKAEDFRTAWKRHSVTRAENGAVRLALVPAPDEAQKDFFGGEIQRGKRTHFGRYEVVMTAARGEGVISSFFTYSGPYFGDPHDEIDMEFLGRDTTKLWVNRFVDGQNLPGRWVDLGFDAAEGPHLYAIDWLPDSLVWSVDGRELMRVTVAEAAIPQTPQRIYLNIWAGGPNQRNWSGEAPDDMRASAEYSCVSYRPPGSEAPMCSDVMPPSGAGDE